ncbi:hypothetical protein [Spiroplasma endosymbiont of Atherix ibis]|uniref:hypothetical protein n=1 Tax=Spiroplasma endosymbiont of Atherix ibis TaxID=3066291 RepID=UPI0030CB9337
MNIGNKKIASRIKENIKENQSSSGSLSILFWSIWISLGNEFDNELMNKLKIFNFINENSSKIFYIFPNYFNDLSNNDHAGNGLKFNNKIDYVLNEKDISFVPARGGAKDKNPDSITFKLGYLAVNFKYEKLFTLSENQQSKAFIKFI